MLSMVHSKVTERQSTNSFQFPTQICATLTCSLRNSSRLKIPTCSGRASLTIRVPAVRGSGGCGRPPSPLSPSFTRARRIRAHHTDSSAHGRAADRLPPGSRRHDDYDRRAADTASLPVSPPNSAPNPPTPPPTFTAAGRVGTWARCHPILLSASAGPGPGRI